MNSISAILDKSDYDIYDDYLNFQIDGKWFDETLEELYPGNMYKGTVPTLLFWMEFEKERNIVWNRILPSDSEKVVCPILMCPDDCDFSCTLIVAEVENSGTTVKWNKVGLDRTKDWQPEMVGTTVEWFDKVEGLEFEQTAYLDMLQTFKNQFEAERLDYEQRKQEWLKEGKTTHNKS